LRNNPDYNEYLKLRNKFTKNAQFYFDAALLFFESGKRYQAAKILSNLTEVFLSDVSQPLRLAAYSYQFLGYHVDAIGLFRYLKKKRPEEPQAYRDLANALAEQAKSTYLSNIQTQKNIANKPSTLGYFTQECIRIYKEALELQYFVITGAWDVRFSQIQVTTMMDYNRVVAQLHEYNMYQLLVTSIGTLLVLILTLNLN
jgi:tetratricopeptide (TPR) repeat protein